MDKHMPTVIAHTQTHNSIKTLRRAVDSILNQTYGNLIYYIADNGSTDGTCEIIAEYAKRDSRIVPLYFPPDGDSSDIYMKVLQSTLERIAEESRGDYYCMLDSDDEYYPDFLEKTLAFIAANDLDLVACGSRFVDEKTGEDVYNFSRSIDYDLILQKKEFKTHFMIYLNSMWTFWGKLYSFPVFQKCVRAGFRGAVGGSDTIFATEAFSHAKRAGILGGALHKYYCSPNSASFNLDDSRVVSLQICIDVLLGYLRKRDILSFENEMIIYSAYFNSIQGIQRLIIDTKKDSLKKLGLLRDIFAHYHTHAMYEYIKYEHLQAFQESAQRYILSLPASRNGRGFDLATDIFAETRDIYVKPDWSCEEVFKFFVSVRAKRILANRDVSETDKIIAEILSKNTLLAGISANGAAFLSDIVYAVLKEDFASALDKIIQVASAEIPDEHAEVVLLLAQNIAAAAENAELYVYFKQIWLSYLLAEARIDEARTELDALAELLPDDPEVAELGQAMNHSCTRI